MNLASSASNRRVCNAGSYSGRWCTLKSKKCASSIGSSSRSHGCLSRWTCRRPNSRRSCSSGNARLGIPHHSIWTPANRRGFYRSIRENYIRRSRSSHRCQSRRWSRPSRSTWVKCGLNRSSRSWRTIRNCRSRFASSPLNQRGSRTNLSRSSHWPGCSIPACHTGRRARRRWSNYCATPARNFRTSSL